MTGTDPTASSALLERYDRAHARRLRHPAAPCSSHGEGCYVWDADGTRYLDLLGGIAVNALGHGHPALVAAVSASRRARLVHVSNFFTTTAQVELAERLLELCRRARRLGGLLRQLRHRGHRGRVKLARRTGRTRIVAAEGALPRPHDGRPRADAQAGLPRAVRAAAARRRRTCRTATRPRCVRRSTGDVGGGRPRADPGRGRGDRGRPAYLRLARELTTAHGALLVLDEVQTGIGRTGSWFAYQQAGVVPDAVTLAKGLGGGVPIGALITFGPTSRACSRPASTARRSAATRSRAPPASRCSTRSRRRACSPGDRARRAPRRGRARDRPPARRRGARARAAPRHRAHGRRVRRRGGRAHGAGFIVNPVQPDALRLAPPLVLTDAQVDDFVAALPALLDGPEASA